MRFFIVIFDINKSLIANLLNAMRNLLPLFVVMALFGCGNKPVKPAWSAGENRHPAYYIYLDPNDTIETVEQVKDNSKSLNDIRFGDWTEEDWRDNDYTIETVEQVKDNSKSLMIFVLATGRRKTGATTTIFVRCVNTLMPVAKGKLLIKIWSHINLY